MPGTYDADTHIAESAAMWDLLPPELYARRPVVVQVPPDTLYKDRDAMWLIDGNIFPRPEGRGATRLITPVDQTFAKLMPDIRARDMTDLDARLREMDVLGTDMQVVFTTLFLAFYTDDAELEVAMCRAYNRHMAEVCGRSEGRIEWILVPPLCDLDAAVEEIRFCAANGAVGVFFRGFEKNRTLDDPFFFPVYEEARAQDVAICIHQGSGCPKLDNLGDFQRGQTFISNRIPPVVAFRNLVANKIPEEFPGLRWGFIEAGASWVPYVLHQLRTIGHDPVNWGPKLFDRYNMWISYEVDEDLPYLVKYIGEDHVVAGTDFAHHGREGVIADPSAQLHMVETIRAREEYSASLMDKLLIHNPRALYGHS